MMKRLIVAAIALSTIFVAVFIPTHQLVHASTCPGYDNVIARYGPGYGTITGSWSHGCTTDFAIATSSGLYILWSPGSGTHVVYGAIGNKYFTSFWPYGATPALGFPTSDEQAISGVNGRTNTFQAGAIYWHASTGTTHAVYGLIYQFYLNHGGPAGCFGGPTSDEFDYTYNGRWLGRQNTFAFGYIHWNNFAQQIEYGYYQNYCTQPNGGGNW